MNWCTSTFSIVTAIVLVSPMTAGVHVQQFLYHAYVHINTWSTFGVMTYIRTPYCHMAFMINSEGTHMGQFLFCGNKDFSLRLPHSLFAKEKMWVNNTWRTSGPSVFKQRINTGGSLWENRIVSSCGGEVSWNINQVNNRPNILWQ